MVWVGSLVNIMPYLGYFVILFELGCRPDFNYLSQKAGVGSAAKLRGYIEDRSAGLNFKALAGDLEPFIFNADDKDKVANFLGHLPNWLTTDK